jgi:hypothetical protein
MDELALHALWGFGDPDARTLLNELQEEIRRREIEGFDRARLVVHRAVVDACEHVERSSPFARPRKLRTLLRMIVESTLESGEPTKQEVLGRRFLWQRRSRSTGPGNRDSESLREQDLIALAARVGLDQTAFASRLKERRYAPRVDADIAIGQSAACVEVRRS